MTHLLDPCYVDLHTVWVGVLLIWRIFSSQMPIVGGAGAFVHLRHIDLSHPRIVPHHVQIGVTQQRLQSEDITATPHGWPRSMWRRCTNVPV